MMAATCTISQDRSGSWIHVPTPSGCRGCSPLGLVLPFPFPNPKRLTYPLPSTVAMPRSGARAAHQSSEPESKKIGNQKESLPERAASARRRRAAAIKEKEVAAVVETLPPAPDIEDTFSSFGPEEARAVCASLLRWYDGNKRSLPWRREKGDSAGGGGEEGLAYAVWVSEVMLQQTRVAAVVGYYNRWMERWPTIRHLADASQEEVNDMWAGLGYYRRARFLLEGAKSIVERGEFPRTASALREVKGIGNYTAGAIASIAFDEVVPVVDGNVVRVLTRLKAISSNPKESSTVKAIWKLAGQLVDPHRPGDFNQSLMELGATLCSVTSPGCSKCPISAQCSAFALSKSSQSVMVTNFPVKVAKPKQRLEYAAVCVIEIAQGLDQKASFNENENPLFLLVKRPDEGLLAGLWEFPSVLVDEEKTKQRLRRETMDQYLKNSFNLDPRVNYTLLFREDVGEYVHVFSHIRLRMYIELLIISTKGGLDRFHDKSKNIALIWKCVEQESIQTMGLTSGIRKVYNMIQVYKKKNEFLSGIYKTASMKKRKKMP